jgi:hypothetical protein
MVSFMPWPLYHQRTSPWYPLDWRLGGPQSWSGCCAEEINSQFLLGLESLIIQPVAQRYTTNDIYDIIHDSSCLLFVKGLKIQRILVMSMTKLLQSDIDSMWKWCVDNRHETQCE